MKFKGAKSPALLGAIGIGKSFYVEITFYLNGKLSLYCEPTKGRNTLGVG
jgi:hypothetical protein